MSLREEILAQHSIRNLDIVFYGDYTIGGNNGKAEWQTWYDIVRYNGKCYKIKQYCAIFDFNNLTPPDVVIEMNPLNFHQENHEIL